MALHVKICGITRPEDYEACVACGVDAVGFVFAPASRRRVTPEGVAALLGAVGAPPVPAIGRTLPPGHPWRVGVFVDPTNDEVRRAATVASLTHVQIHGDATEGLLAARAMGCHLLYPLAVRRPLTEKDFHATHQPDAWLCDAWSQGEHGGTGRGFDHDFIRPWLAREPLWLAGGLAPDAIRETVALLPGLLGVDVSTGVESAPGKKDPELIRRFVQEARAGSDAARATPR